MTVMREALKLTREADAILQGRISVKLGLEKADYTRIVEILSKDLPAALAAPGEPVAWRSIEDAPQALKDIEAARSDKANRPIIDFGGTLKNSAPFIIQRHWCSGEAERWMILPRWEGTLTDTSASPRALDVDEIARIKKLLEAVRDHSGVATWRNEARELAVVLAKGSK